MRSSSPPTSRPTPRSLATLLSFMALAALLLAGCGASSASASTSSTPAPTPTSAPTPVPTVNLAMLSGPCAPDTGNARDTTPRSQIGDLIVTEARLSLAYPAQQLPDGTPLRPVQLPGRHLAAA